MTTQPTREEIRRMLGWYLNTPAPDTTAQR